MKPSEWIEAKAQSKFVEELTIENMGRMADLLGYPEESKQLFLEMLKDPEEVAKLAASPEFKQAMHQTKLNLTVVATAELLDKLFPDVDAALAEKDATSKA